MLEVALKAITESESELEYNHSVLGSEAAARTRESYFPFTSPPKARQAPRRAVAAS